jgi:hypothetical protein
MSYGTIKVDTITFTDNSVDKSVSLSGLIQNPTFTGNITVTGTISGDVIRGGTTVSGATVTGTTANFVSGVFTTQISGATVTGTTASFTSGVFTNISGTTATITSGIIASGTAAAPSLAILADLDTGLFSPGANELAVATNGTGRLFVDASGSISTSSTAWQGDSTYQLGGLQIGASTYAKALLQTGGTSRAEWLFDSADNYLLAKSGSFYIFNTTANPITFATNGSERLRITSAGLVGIGTSSPSKKLHVSAASGDVDALVECPGHPILRLKTTGTTDNTSVDFADSGSDTQCRLIYTHSTDLFRILHSGNNALSIDSSGSVGIGTTSPRRTLEVSGADGLLCINATDTSTGTSQLLFGDNDDDNIGRIYYDHGTDNMAFWTNTSEKARIDTSGRLLVGTSSARSDFFSSLSSKLQIEGTDSATAAVSITRNSADASGAILTIAKTRGAAVGGTTIVDNNDTLGIIAFQGYDGTDFRPAAYITAEVGSPPGADDMPGRLIFSTTADGGSLPTERMRINNGGQISQFCDTGWDNIRASSASAAGTTRSFYTGYYSATGVNTGTVSYRVRTNGNVQNTNNSYGAISDIKLKENIVDANSQWDDLKALQVRNYNFKEGQTHTQIGLVAQEVELVSPGLVSESPDHDEEGNDLGTVTKSVNYSVLYMKSVKALQEAMERIETLQGMVAVNNITIDEQQHQISALAARLTALESA